VILVPVVGAILIGLMARYGSDRIRGHGIPEAIESILIHGSRVAPKVALLKPLSSAISIGSGRAVRRRGPDHHDGGRVRIARRAVLPPDRHRAKRPLLVAGAAAGMSAPFAAPVASVVLAVELLLFEWKPRSIIPVALASVTAAPPCGGTSSASGPSSPCLRTRPSSAGRTPRLRGRRSRWLACCRQF